MKTKSSKNANRPGFSFLELEVALALLGIGLSGLLPLVVMQSKQLNRIESRFNDQTSYYLAHSTNAWARKLGVPATIQTEDPGTVTAELAFEAYINFQCPVDPDPGVFDGNDYEADGGWVFGDRGNGYTYGWNVDNTGNARNRGSGISPDERYQSFNYMQKLESTFIWEIAIPNGTYQVHLVAGDPVPEPHSVYKINVEGVLFIDGIPTGSNRWLENTAAVTVTDGRLTVSNAPDASKNKICFIDICPAYEVQILSLDRSLVSEEVTAQVEVVER